MQAAVARAAWVAQQEAVMAEEHPVVEAAKAAALEVGAKARAVAARGAEAREAACLVVAREEEPSVELRRMG